jgi:hypothetical protein
LFALFTRHQNPPSKNVSILHPPFVTLFGDASKAVEK